MPTVFFHLTLIYVSQGFEPRGTELSERLVTFENLVGNVGGKTNLVPFATHIHPADNNHQPVARLQTSRLSHPAGAKPNLVPVLAVRQLPLGSSLAKQQPGVSSQAPAHYSSRQSVVGGDHKAEYADSTRHRLRGWGGGKQRGRWSKRIKKGIGKRGRDTALFPYGAGDVMADAPVATHTNSTGSKFRSFCGVPGEFYISSPYQLGFFLCVVLIILMTFLFWRIEPDHHQIGRAGMSTSLHSKL